MDHNSPQTRALVVGIVVAAIDKDWHALEAHIETVADPADRALVLRNAVVLAGAALDGAGVTAAAFAREAEIRLLTADLDASTDDPPASAND